MTPELRNIDYFLGFLTILPWALTLWVCYPKDVPVSRKVLAVVGGLTLGWIATECILIIHPKIWPETSTFVKPKGTILTQTLHIAFIQAGMMEEGFKILFHLILGFSFSYSFKNRTWNKDIVMQGAFVALGFALIENSQYLFREEDSNKKFLLFLARSVYSANIHLLINLCFGFFLLKSNGIEDFKERAIYVLWGFVLAIIQHGVADFFLLPGSSFGSWICEGLFVGIWVWVVRDWHNYLYPNSNFFHQNNLKDWEPEKN